MIPVIPVIPEEPPPVPGPVAALAAGRPLRAVWQNALGGLTFEIGPGQIGPGQIGPGGAGPGGAGPGDGRFFVKWAPAGSGLDLAGEAPRLRWAGQFTPVPRVLAEGSDASGAWLVTAALPGRSAVDPRWQAEPRTAVIAIGEGLRAMHEALPAGSCPFSWTASDRVADAHRRAALGAIDPAGWNPLHEHLGVDRALEIVSDIPPATRTVVCHGDSCSPNTLLTDDGRWSAHVDLDSLGVADAWADLAVATWATQWNYGPGWEGLLLDAYGIAAEDDLIRYYRLLWQLGP